MKLLSLFFVLIFVVVSVCLADETLTLQTGGATASTFTIVPYRSATGIIYKNTSAATIRVRAVLANGDVKQYYFRDPGNVNTAVMPMRILDFGDMTDSLYVYKSSTTSTSVGVTLVAHKEKALSTRH